MQKKKAGKYDPCVRKKPINRNEQTSVIEMEDRTLKEYIAVIVFLCSRRQKRLRMPARDTGNIKKKQMNHLESSITLKNN